MSQTNNAIQVFTTHKATELRSTAMQQNATQPL